MLKKPVLFLIIILTVFLNACEDKNKPSPGGEVVDEEAKTNVESKTLNKGLEMVSTTDEYGNMVEYSRRKSDFAKQGRYAVANERGQLLELAHYKNDTLHGVRVLFYEATGDTQIVENYSQGLFEGPYRTYHINGILEQEGLYIASVMDGTWIRYYDTGELQEEVVFRDNNENGPFKEYYENGNLRAEGYYKDGDNEDGSLKLYNEEGELIRTMNCVKGICKTIWKKEEMQ